MSTSPSSILFSAATGTMATAAFFVRGKEILIGLRHYASGPLWTTPGGKCQSGETVEMSLRREVTEEVWLEDFRILAHLGDVPAAHPDWTLSVFLCESDAEPELREPDKFSEWRWQHIEAIPENFINPWALELVKQYLSQ